MASVKVYNIEGKEVGTLELNDAVFGVEVNEHLMHLAVVSQLANKRQGTQSAKTRAEVSGGGRKPWRQKGTGHARQGSTRAPQWTGGGVVFAPKPRDYSVKMNKKEKAAAIKSAKFNFKTLVHNLTTVYCSFGYTNFRNRIDFNQKVFSGLVVPVSAECQTVT